MELITVLLVALVACWVVIAVCHVVARVKPVQRDERPHGSADVLLNTEHRFGLVADSFDGLWENWICRICGLEHKRKRPGL